MKKVIFLFVATSLLFGFTTVCNAQEESLDKVLSARYEQEIKIVESEIKTLKMKLDSDKGNKVLKSELLAKKERKSELRKDKNILDKAIKDKKDAEKIAKEAEKIAKKAERAMEKAEKAIREADKLKEERLLKGA